MCRSLMIIIRELYPYLTKVTFMLKHSVKLRLYVYLVMWQHVVERHVCCVQCTHKIRRFQNARCRDKTYNNVVYCILSFG